MTPSETKTKERFLGRYDLIRTLGAGGMGVVYLAYDVELRREVALKRIRSGTKSTSLQERFRREYQALAAVQHTGVPAIFYSGRPVTDDAYFTMEIVKGETLREHMDRGKIAPLRALDLAIDLGRVLMAVHTVGIVHRDVKPSNIILEIGDRLRLIDFGVCYLSGVYYNQPHLRAVTDEGERWGTGDLEFVGTTAYTDPQHVTEGITSPQSDVFSVCVVLYEMIAGRYLFDETTMRHRPIVAEEFAPELAPLVAELQRGIAPTYERHASMEDLVRRLEIVRSSLAATQPTRTTRPRRWLLASAVAVAFLSGLAVARLMDTRTDAALSPDAPNVPVEKSMSLKTYDFQSDVATPPDDAPAAAEAVADTRPPDELAPKSAGDPSPEKTVLTRPPKPAPATTWEARMRKAEASARRCLDAAGVEARPLVVTILPDAPAQVRRVGSDSTHARCIREALDRHDLRVDRDRRQHTFFAKPTP